MYPTKMEANGHIYSINTDYRIALACLKAIEDDTISDLERFYAIECLLLGNNVLPADELILKNKIENYLRCGKEKNTDESEKDMDYFQDMRRISISIKQEYGGVDINTLEYLHWWEFNDMIEGLTDDSLLDRIRRLRTVDVTTIDDEKEKKKIIEAQKQISLNKNRKSNISEKQIKSIQEFIRLTSLERS